MTQTTNEMQIRVGGFESVSKVELVVRRLLAAGYAKDELVVICPAKYQDQLSSDVPQTETPETGTGQVLATGGAAGAALGGIALIATVLTGGIAGPAAAVLIGGGAIAGGFSNLIVSKGYDEEAIGHYKQAVQKGWIVVGVKVPVEAGPDRTALAEQILNESGAKTLEPARVAS